MATLTKAVKELLSDAYHYLDDKSNWIQGVEQRGAQVCAIGSVKRSRAKLSMSFRSEERALRILADQLVGVGHDVELYPPDVLNIIARENDRRGGYGRIRRALRSILKIKPVRAVKLPPTISKLRAARDAVRARTRRSTTDRQSVRN